jgi:hypothetical protein
MPERFKGLFAALVGDDRRYPLEHRLLNTSACSTA